MQADDFLKEPKAWCPVWCHSGPALPVTCESSGDQTWRLQAHRLHAVVFSQASAAWPDDLMGVERTVRALSLGGESQRVVPD